MLRPLFARLPPARIRAAWLQAGLKISKTMASAGKILITRKQIAAAGGIKAALDEAHSLASLQMTPRAMTIYEAVGSLPTDTDGAGILVQIEIQNEQELREALEAGAQAVLLNGPNPREAQRLAEIAREFRADCVVDFPSD